MIVRAHEDHEPSQNDDANVTATSGEMSVPLARLDQAQPSFSRR
jgi:hypothetical protein